MIEKCLTSGTGVKECKDIDAEELSVLIIQDILHNYHKNRESSDHHARNNLSLPPPTIMSAVLHTMHMSFPQIATQTYPLINDH